MNDQQPSQQYKYELHLAIPQAPSQVHITPSSSIDRSLTFQEESEQHQRGRPTISTHKSRNSGSRATSRSRRSGSRPNSRPVSWLIKANSDYTSIYDNYGGVRSRRNSIADENNVSAAEKGLQGGYSSKSSLNGGNSHGSPNEKLTPGSMHSGLGSPLASRTGTMIRQDGSPIGSVHEQPRRNISALKASFLLGKAFVGTGVLFLPRAFMNGVQVRLIVRETFQDMGLVLYGKYMRLAVLLAVALSQIGLAHNGLGPDIALFNRNDFALFIGTAVFSFEGIGLIIPITESMAEPEKFPRVLAMTMTVVTMIFGSVGALCYSSFGSKVQTIVLLNLPIRGEMTITVEILYSCAIILSVPLMLSPASRIIEHGIFGDKSGGQHFKVKMQKNLLRTTLICGCAVISFVIGGPNLDKSVSFVGSAACMPLCFIFPALFHYKACAKTTKDKVLDILLGLFGVAVMIFTMYITIRSWVVVAAPEAPLDRCTAFLHL
ncbi:neutral amino acid transporter [Mortierella sp. AD094]|nr:neutral amino acid transporter [Mortierella sp. AD094]